MYKALKYTGIATVVVGGLFEFWLAFFGHVTLCPSGLAPCYGYYILPLWVPLVVLAFGVYLIIPSKCIERANRNGVKLSRLPIHKAVPKEIADDYREALQCYDVKAFKSSVAMARRVLQTTCKIKGATKIDLKDQIDEIMLASAKHSLEHVRAKRALGYLNAHSADFANDITEQDALDVLTVRELVLQAMVVQPYIVEQWLEEEARRASA